ncbi:MAG: hypothetical protein KF726_20250 [Anaerolineae bacterium]|nr:hypothetical protein [Anaerolineae bacterium]
MWSNLRYKLMFAIACLASPCCTPLLVPLIIGLLAGTPAALWMSQHVGLVYGLLTGISIASFIIGLRWMNNRRSANPQPITLRLSEVPIVLPAALRSGEPEHVE